MSLVEKWIEEIKEIFKAKEKRKEEVNKEILKNLYEEEIRLLKQFCKDNDRQVFIRSSNIFIPISCQEALKYLESKLEELKKS
ncbi:MAG TPA: hypothetical protein EYH39_03510 [Desulfurobacteriaceae bacterium]|nr:hypothetical protein [Desulfurobacteriaceae bacterium]